MNKAPRSYINGLNLLVNGGGSTSEVQEDLLDVKELLGISISSSNIQRDVVDFLLITEEGVVFRSRP